MRTVRLVVSATSRRLARHSRVRGRRTAPVRRATRRALPGSASVPTPSSVKTSAPAKRAARISTSPPLTNGSLDPLTSSDGALPALASSSNTRRALLARHPAIRSASTAAASSRRAEKCSPAGPPPDLPQPRPRLWPPPSRWTGHHRFVPGSSLDYGQSPLSTRAQAG